MNKEKVFKYLGYAIGEIFLVVIGIVIALQLDNWNDSRQQREVEIKYLKEIRNNLVSDRADIAWNINFNEEKQASARHIMKFLDREIPYSDTLRRHFGNLTLNVTRSIVNVSAYENVKSRGLEIISNDSLRQAITTLYSVRFYNVMNFEEHDDHPFHYSVFMPEALKALKIIEPWKDALPAGPVRILRNHEFASALHTSYFIKEHSIGWYQDLQKDVENTIAIIDKELLRLD
jgi:hypothetical protein